MPVNAPKILVVVTNHAKYEQVNRPTGLWLGEFVHFYDEFRYPEVTIDLVSPSGGKSPLDPESTKRLVTDPAIRAFEADPAKMSLLDQTLKAADVQAERYDVIYYTGGHGTMYDFPDEPHLQAAARTIFEKGGWVVAVCHGVAGLLNIKLSNGEYLVTGKKLTGYSDREELFGRTKDLVPFSLEERLRERGAEYSRSFVPFVSNTQADGRLLTGQNPFSTRALARLLLERLRS